jgi:hypothetical protein
MTELEKLEKLKAQNAELSDRIAKLEEAAKPPEPFKSEYRGPIDRTAGMSMPANAMKAMVDALPSSFFADLRGDARRPNPVTGGPAPSPTPQGPRGTGWREPAPLEVPFVALADKLVDTQDKIDHAERVQQFAKAAAIEKATKENK